MAPCSATLTPGEPYRVDAPGMVSTSFVAKAEQRNLRVDGGSATARVGGLVLVALGGGAVAFAGGLASAVSQGLTDHSMSTDTAKPLLTVSIVTLTVGAAFLVSGWILALANGTSVTPDAAKARPAARNVWITPTGLSF
ncbi:MAG: hypothetical protein HOO96_20645 [Polyangiaceae bacterium]|nr:hypothetical protein [Polyangiaceae bacterium]